jgi:hypothetical protein
LCRHYLLHFLCSKFFATLPYNDYPDEYIAFSIILNGCIDGLDTCLASKYNNQEIRLHILRVLFAIYRFYTDHSMDLDEDIPDLLVGNTTSEERQIIIDWVRDALSALKETDRSDKSNRRDYQRFLASLARANKQ